MIKCSYCNELIGDNSKTCFNCGHNFSVEELYERKEDKAKEKEADYDARKAQFIKENEKLGDLSIFFYFSFILLFVSLILDNIIFTIIGIILLIASVIIFIKGRSDYSVYSHDCPRCGKEFYRLKNPDYCPVCGKRIM